MNNYIVDFNKLCDNLLPPVLRVSRLRVFLYSMVSQISELKSKFDVFKLETEYEQNVTVQTIWLEKVLNDRFDNSYRRISIIHQLDDVLIGYFDNENQNPIVGYFDNEGQPANIGYFEGESGSSLTSDFRVLVKIPSLSAIVGYFDNEGQPANIGYFDNEGQPANIGYFDTEEPFLNQINSTVKKYKQAGKTFDISF